MSFASQNHRSVANCVHLYARASKKYILSILFVQAKFDLANALKEKNTLALTV